MIENYDELWLPVKGFEGYYEVSNMGNVRSLSRMANHRIEGYERVIYGKMLRLRTNKKRYNYMEICLTNNAGEKNCKVHRLVAEAFLNNPNNYPQVNHKNFDVTDNRVENLEWCDAKYNINYSKERRPDMKGKWGKTIEAYNMQGVLVGTYGSVREAARQLNCHGQNICSVLKGKGKWVKGHTFKEVLSPILEAKKIFKQLAA